MLRGSMVALVTPFRNGALDESAFRSFVRWQLEQGTAALVPAGTTGEGATLTADEHARAVRICAEEARGKVPVIAGCGTNATASTIDNVRRAREAGATHALVVTPYYNKPTQEGLFRHFEAVAQNGGLPVVLYNVPSRTSVDLLPETVARCAQVRGIVGVKEASGQIPRVAEIRNAVPADFAILAGDDMFTLATLAMGGQGVVSVVGNVAPKNLARLCESFFAGDLATARALQNAFAPLVRAMFLETNPLPVKYACAQLGHCGSEVRLPLVPLGEATARKVDEALRAYGLLS